jgi:hypothetical protein
MSPILSAGKSVEFVSDTMSHITLRFRCCDIIVLNVQGPTKDKTVYVMESFYEELEYVFDKFPKYLIKILLQNLSAKVGKEDVFKQIIVNARLHKIRNDNGIRVANFATSKNLAIESTFPHHNVQKFIGLS